MIWDTSSIIFTFDRLVFHQLMGKDAAWLEFAVLTHAPAGGWN